MMALSKISGKPRASLVNETDYNNVLSMLFIVGPGGKKEVV